jgi:dihydropteroate synthase
MQKRYLWKLKQREITLGERTLIMGILNVTPDSFSDGGKYYDPDRALARALEMEDEGADIVDIGAESTRPGSQRISEAEELRRLIPVLKRLRGKLAVPISVDTYKAGVAEKALEHGAEIINDPSGLMFDMQLPKVVTKHDAGLVINHMRGTPETWAKLGPLKDLMRSITLDLEAAIHRARQSGVQKQQIVIDPGLGFGKRREQDLEMIASLSALQELDLPILVGPSRKRFLKKETEELTEFATAAAVAASILKGAHIVRVHNVKAMRAVAEVADAIRDAAPEEERVAQVRWHRGQ